jgi:hypothetical protein
VNAFIIRDQARDGLAHSIGSGANEKRFDYVWRPSKYLGTYREPRPPIFDKLRPRDDIMHLKNMHLQDYNPKLPCHLDSLKIGSRIVTQIVVVELKKMQPRLSASPCKRGLIPESYPQAQIDAGFAQLGHVKRVSSPVLDKMLPRNNRMYGIPDPRSNQDKEEAIILKHYSIGTAGSIKSQAKPFLSILKPHRTPQNEPTHN